MRHNLEVFVYDREIQAHGPPTHMVEETTIFTFHLGFVLRRGNLNPSII